MPRVPEPKLKVGDRLTQQSFDDLWIYQVSEMRYKSGMKYRLKVVSEGHWSTGGRWMTAKEILRQYKPDPMGTFLYV